MNIIRIANRYLKNKIFKEISQRINGNWHIEPAGSHDSDPFKKYFNQNSRLEYLVQKLQNYETWTDEEHIDYYNLRLAELPEDIVNKAVEVLKNNLSPEMQLHIYNLHRINPLHWVTENFMHHGWGTNVRNLLRKEVCLDDDLLSEYGWDDYYQQLVEITVGAREYSKHE